MTPLKPSGSVKGEDKDKFMEELERARITSSLQSRRLQAIIRRAEWVPEARKEVAARKEFNNTKKLLEIFPDLVWEAILDRVGDSKDKAVMSNMTEMWRNLFKGEKTKFLFQGVFSILHSNGYLPARNDMLTCRLVCKDWKRSIEDYLQSSERKTDLDFLAPRPLPMLEMTSHFEFNLLDPYLREVCNLRPGFSAVEFLRSAQNEYSGENPFISRKLILGMPGPLFNYNFSRHQIIWGPGEEILERWGRELWELTLCFNRAMPDFMVYNEIYDKLELCPNLRYLRIICNEYRELDVNSHIGIQMKEQRNSGQCIYELLSYYMKCKPHLPDLPYLKSLQTTFVPAPIIQAMIKKYGSTLETLCGGTFEANPTDFVHKSVLPELKEFKSFYFVPDIEETKLNFTAEWPNLKELTLLFENVREGNISGFFESLNRFSSGGLRKLTLHLHNEDGAIAKLCKRVINNLSLELPDLEVMTLSVCRINLSSIDFLLPLVNLKELNLIYVKHLSRCACDECEVETGAGNGKKTPVIKPNPDELIKLSDFTNRLYESNIWRVFPELKVVRIGVVKILTGNMLGKRVGGRSTEQERLLQIWDVSGMTWNHRDVKRSVLTKRKVYTRERYELHMRSTD